MVCFYEMFQVRPRGQALLLSLPAGDVLSLSRGVWGLPQLPARGVVKVVRDTTLRAKGKAALTQGPWCGMQGPLQREREVGLNCDYKEKCVCVRDRARGFSGWEVTEKITN